jgi:hypothetical protein
MIERRAVKSNGLYIRVFVGEGDRRAILYEHKCARISWLKGMLSPPKEKKLVLESVRIHHDGDEDRA